MRLFSSIIDGIVAFIVICYVLPSLVLKTDSNKKHKRINWASIISYTIIFAVGIGVLIYLKQSN